MADPTEYDLVQDQQIKDLQDLVQTNQTPPAGSEYSFPAERMPIDQTQFSLLSLATSDGVLDQGGGPYTLTGLKNVNNTGTLRVSSISGKAYAVVAGFFHVLTQDMRISLPAVTSTTTYHVCLTYDPRKLGDQGDENTEPQGPVSVQVYAGTPPTDQGRKHVILYKITRTPNQLLTDATVDTIRPRVAPVGYVATVDQLPDPATRLWGSLFHVGESGDLYRVNGSDGSTPNTWTNLSKHTWVEPGYATDTYKWPGHGDKIGYQVTADAIYLRGRIALNTGAAFQLNPGGYYALTLPAVLGAHEARFVVSGQIAGTGKPALAGVNVASNGSVRIFPYDTTATWFGLDGIRIPR